MKRLAALAAVLLAGACVGPDLPDKIVINPAPSIGTPVPDAPKVDAQISTVLVKLAEDKTRFRRDLTAAEGTPIGDLLTVGSPIGFDLRNRFLGLGIPLAEAFAANPDPVFRQQLSDIARWDRDGEARAAALIAIARQKDPAHLGILNEALINLNPGVRFGALEALTIWGHPQKAMPLLAAASERDSEPLLRVYAAAGLVRLGDPAGLHRLRGFIDNPSWVVKAMAAKYLGDLGTAEDYDLLLGRVDREVTNDFVVAEFCVAALKLYPKKKASMPQPAAAAPPPSPAPSRVFDASGMLGALEPLVITAPRVQVQRDLIDPRINNHLKRLLANRMDARPDSIASMDASVGNLAKLTTITGYNLKTRYTELGFLLTEGLAGTTDFSLQSELEKVVKFGKNVQTRAAAMIALAHTKNRIYLPMFQNALIDPSVTVRFAGVESLLILGGDLVLPQVGQAARADASLPVQVFASAGMWKLGDNYGRELLLRHIQHADWLIRAMGAHYLGEMGGEYEFQKLLREFQFEKDAVAQAEMAGALLKIQSRLEKR